MALDRSFTRLGTPLADLDAAWRDRLADAEALFAARRHAWAIAMALPATLRHAVQRLAQVFQDYATTQGWRPDGYRVFVRLKPKWGRIHIILVAKSFPGKGPGDQWLSVRDFLEEKLRDEPGLLESLNLSLRTFDQVAEGGIYAIGPPFMDIQDLLTSGAALGSGA